MQIPQQLQGWGRNCWELLGSGQGSIHPGVSWCAQQPGEGQSCSGIPSKPPGIVPTSPLWGCTPLTPSRQHGHCQMFIFTG